MRRSMTAHPFDRATALDGHGDVRHGHTSDEYWAFVGPFGGVLSAVLLRAVLEHSDRLGESLALTVNFCAPLAKGPFAVTARPARTNRSTQHWFLALTQAGETILTGTAVTAERRESWSHGSASAPAVAASGDLRPYVLPRSEMTWVEQYDFRFAEGAPRLGQASADNPASPLSHLWLRDAQPRPLDHLALASMADAFFGRVFHVRGEIVPFGTVSLTTYFLGSADEIAEQGEAPVLGRADATRFHRGFGDQTIDLWGKNGALLARGVQIAYFKA